MSARRGQCKFLDKTGVLPNGVLGNGLILNGLDGYRGWSPSPPLWETAHHLEVHPVRWSFRLATLAGIRIEVHVTFLLMVAGLALFQSNSNPVWLTVSELLLLFLCVLLHELGHALAARRCMAIGIALVAVWLAWETRSL